jgi:Family of unknown function (DUF6884)
MEASATSAAVLTGSATPDVYRPQAVAQYDGDPAMIEDTELQNLADRIRRFVFQRYVGSARAQGNPMVEVRTGDVHRAMGLVGRMPAVCSALGAKFERDYGVRLVDRRGPTQGANVFLRFHIGDGTGGRPSDPGQGGVATAPEFSHNDWQPEQRSAAHQQTAGDRVFLVSCASAKRGSAARARDLYVSDWFRKARAYVERVGGPWFILSAQYGLLPPDRVICPYERTLNTMPLLERQGWARRVADQLSEAAPNTTHVVFLAGARYREYLGRYLMERGITAEVPMEGLRIGEQLHRLRRS